MANPRAHHFTVVHPRHTESSPLVDITDVGPGEQLANLSIESATTSISSAGLARRSHAADALNRDLLFGESERPDDLTEDWCYVSDKNARKRVEHATSDFDTFVHLLKGNIGTGLLTLPMATKDAGYLVGPIGILIIGTISMHCMALLVQCANKLCEWNQIPALDYSETMQFALKERGVPSRLAKVAKVLVNIFLMITQFGFCSVYFVFMGENLKQIMDDAFCTDYISIKVWIVILILPVVLFNWIRNLDNLAPLATLANIAMLAGLVFIFYDEIYHFSTREGFEEAPIRKHPSNLHSFGSFLNISLFFGNVIFSFEGIGVILPLENKMKTPRHAKYLIYSGMSLITILYAVFALMGYLAYGENVADTVTLNLCSRNSITAVIFLVAKLLFIYNAFASFLLQFYVPLDFLEPPLFKKLKLDFLTYKFPKYHNWIKTGVQLGFRTLLVLFTAALALGIPDLNDLVTLIGAVASSALAMIFPPLIHMLVFWKVKDERCWFCLPKPFWMTKDIIIMVLGVIGFLAGTFASFNSVIHHFEHSKTEIPIYCSNEVEAPCKYY